MNRQLFKYHPNIGHTFIPNLKTRIMHEGGGYLIKVNQAGFRSNREFEPVKKPGVFRILLFGDSFTAGDGVSNAKRYSDLLEAFFPGLEVYNFGLSGTGTDQQYLVFQEMADVMEHDLLLISVTVENIRRVRARYKAYQSHDGKMSIYPKPYFSLTSDGNLQRHNFPVPKGPLSRDQLPSHEKHFVDRGGRFNWLYRCNFSQ
ncbi:MAG: SGNH/GDSL hydrolase family protein [Deltaproteobacteria bacterium]|nr:SGNH/GDSL hydrolase family protein [Deltaproteobacteria bacterium]